MKSLIDYVDIVRYEPVGFINRGGEQDAKMVPDPAGKWVPIESVEGLVKATIGELDRLLDDLTDKFGLDE